MSPDGNAAQLAEIPSDEPANAAYDEIFRERGRRLAAMRKKASEWRKVRRYYQEHVADYINDWGVTADPRLVRLGKRSVMPFMLFPRQREWVDWTYEGWRSGQYGITVKSRDVGVSWLACAFAVSICELFEDIAAGFGSYKQDKVDNGADPGSLFWKMRLYVAWQPLELRAGCDLDRDAHMMKLFFPNTNGSVIGEVGDNIGRGSRTSIYFVDETAHLEHGELADAGLSSTTDCRQDMSSVFGMGNSFAQRAHDPNLRRFDFRWQQDPRKDAAWYEGMREKWGAVIVAQEVDCNFSASIEDIVLPPEWIEAMVDLHVYLCLEMTGERRGALDVADKGQDKNAFVGAIGNLVTKVKPWSGRETGDIYASVEEAFALVDQLGGSALIYDADGLGAGCEGDARKINEDRKKNRKPLLEVIGFLGSGALVDPKGELMEGRVNEDYFENFKAQAWISLRMRAQASYRARKGLPYNRDEIISIDSTAIDKATLAQLKIELSQPQYARAKSGKMLIEKAPKGAPSPNLADAFMMLFAPLERSVKVDAGFVRKFERAFAALPGA